MSLKQLAGVCLSTAALLIGCGDDDDGDTTIIQQAPPTTATGAGDAFVVDPVGRRSAQPSEFSFSVTGDLIGTNLTWEGWGSPSATATGNFDFNEAPHDQPTTTVSGTLTVGDPQPCNGDLYYTSVQFNFDQTPPFQPQAPTLQTDCD